MDINRDNYEAYFLDYAEGKLSAVQQEILHRFLKFNPDLSDELRAFSIQPLPHEHVDLPNKEFLKKRFPEVSEILNEQNFDMFCIAYLEGDLSPESRLLFDDFLIAKPEFQLKVDSFKKTYLLPEKLSYPRKKELKRKSPLNINWRVLTPFLAAAAVLFIFVLGPFSSSEPDMPAERNEFALYIEPEFKDPVVETLAEEKKPPSNSIPATLKMIRGSKVPVPVSDYKKKEDEAKARQEKEASENKQASARIAGLDLRTLPVVNIPVRHDQIVFVALTPPAIHGSSLSARDMARYQFQRASKAMEEEDVLIWNLASSGLKEINKLTGSKAQLMASKDEEGSISGIQFKSRILNFTAPISKEE